MNQDKDNLNNKTYLNNNNLLIGIVNDLQQLINKINDNLLIKRIADIIIRINFIISENKKNNELIMNQFSLLNKKLDILIMKKEEIKYQNGRYVGQVVNGLREGKGIMYFNNNDRYEGYFQNDEANGKGIYYYNEKVFKGDRYDGDWKNNKKEGKGVYYFNNGDRYDGDYKNDIPEGNGIYYNYNGNVYVGEHRNGLKEGKGIIYYNNGDREMGDYLNDKPIGKHVKLTNNGEIRENNY